MITGNCLYPPCNKQKNDDVRGYPIKPGALRCCVLSGFKKLNDMQPDVNPEGLDCYAECCCHHPKKPTYVNAVNVTTTFITFYRVIFFLCFLQFIVASALLLARCFQNRKAINVLVFTNGVTYPLFVIWVGIGTYWRYRNAGRVCTGLFEHEYDPINVKGDRWAVEAPKMK